ncbi:MAG: ethanolamine ammonia-lyase subunit EutC [Formivibrio sp.]|nr:ethanolamine ammonia-lyase subunit EutC [Formivibrio sp.]
MSEITRLDPWQELKQFTAARIAIGRTGASQPTDAVLSFGVAHAQARDAVHLPFEVDSLRQQLEALDFSTLTVHSAADNRGIYLRRPDLGRTLSSASENMLATASDKGRDVVFMVGDGLSSKAIHRHAVPFLVEARSRLEQSGFSIGPVVLAEQARVALGDGVGEKLQAKFVVVLIGERPGLSSPDSMGLYLTWQPRQGRMDSERNCISNIRPEGLPYQDAVKKLEWLIREADRLQLTGVDLKDQSDLLPAA